MQRGKVGMILLGIIGVFVLGQGSGWSAFEVTEKSATLDSPPENPSPLTVGDILTVQSDHKITVKKVSTADPQQFWYAFRNNNTCSGQGKQSPENPEPIGMNWRVNDQDTWEIFDLFHQSQMNMPGYFTANAYTDWCHMTWKTVANDSRAFQVVRP